MRALRSFRACLKNCALRHLPQPFLATGVRPVADPGLRVQVHEAHGALHLRTASLEITFGMTLDRAAATLTLLNLDTKASWAFSLPVAVAAQNTAAPAVAVAARARPAITRLQNTWTLALPGQAPSGAIKLEVLQAAMVRVTIVEPDSSGGNGGANAGAANHVAAPVTLHIAGADPCFGLGERFSHASLAGTHFNARPSDRSGEPGHNWSYVAVPLVYTPSGMGLYADTVFDTDFNFNPTASGFDLRVANNPLSLYFFSGANPKAILQQYTALTGRPQNPPSWTFGPWINAVQGDGAVLDLAKRVRAEGIPASALWVFDELDEPNNLGWPFWYSSYYGNPRTFNDVLHAQGFKVLGYVHPYVRELMLPYPVPSPAYQKGVAEHLLVTGIDGLPHGPTFEPVRTGNLDFTNPRTVDWWQTMITHAVRDQAWDGWMEDFGEYVDDSDRLAAGDGSRLSEVYPLLYHKITTRVAQALNPQVVSFSRSGFVGTQQFSPVLWGGDQEHSWAPDLGLPSVVTAGITAGMSGYSNWGPDILSDGADKELWMRWAEFAALTPVMRDHVWSKPEFSVNLWHDAETRSLFRKYALLHSALLPYFVTYAAEAHRTGVPILRHTVLEYPADPRSTTAEYQYLLGDSLLIAPVIEPGAVKRTLYLPHGDWVNYWTGEHLAGGADVIVPAPLEQIPMLVRAGSILPFKPEAETASFNWSDPALLSGSLVWKVYPPANRSAAAGSFTLPDGTGAELSGTTGGWQIVGASPSARAYEVMVSMEAAPSAVELDGKLLPTGAAGAVPAGSWWFDPAMHQLHASFTASAFTLAVRAPSNGGATGSSGR